VVRPADTIETERPSRLWGWCPRECGQRIGVLEVPAAWGFHHRSRSVVHARRYHYHYHTLIIILCYSVVVVVIDDKWLTNQCAQPGNLYTNRILVHRWDEHNSRAAENCKQVYIVVVNCTSTHYIALLNSGVRSL